MKHKTLDDAKRFFINWYSNPDIRKQMLKYTLNREFCYLSKEPNTPMIRFNRMHKDSDYQYHLGRWVKYYMNERNILFNMYYSIAEYKWGLHSKLALMNNIVLRNWWKENNWKSIVKYPFVIDIDAPSHKDFRYAKFSAKEIHLLLKEINVPHEIIFSGMGFHFVIPYEELGYSFDPENTKNIYSLYAKIAIFLYNNYSELVDLRIYDLRRIIKIPFSLSWYGLECFVCVPITTTRNLFDCTIDNFNPQNCHLTLGETKLFSPHGTIKNLIKEVTK